MSIIAGVRSNERVIGEQMVIQVTAELSERNKVTPLRIAVDHIREESERIVMLQVYPSISAGISHRGQTFHIRLPGFPCCEQMPHDVVS